MMPELLAGHWSLVAVVVAGSPPLEPVCVQAGAWVQRNAKSKVLTEQEHSMQMHIKPLGI
jgi:hypothetical protein